MEPALDGFSSSTNNLLLRSCYETPRESLSGTINLDMISVVRLFMVGYHTVMRIVQSFDFSDVDIRQDCELNELGGELVHSGTVAFFNRHTLHSIDPIRIGLSISHVETAIQEGALVAVEALQELERVSVNPTGQKEFCELLEKEIVANGFRVFKLHKQPSSSLIG